MLNPRQLIYEFERKLATKKLAIKDYTGYPIQILLYNNIPKSSYGETKMTKDCQK